MEVSIDPDEPSELRHAAKAFDAAIDIHVKDLIGRRHEPWPDEADRFIEEMSWTGFLAWAWQRRKSAIAAELKRRELREIDRRRKNAALPPDLRDPTITKDESLAAFDRAIEQRAKRHEGLLARTFFVPGGRHSNPVMLADMDSDDCFAVAHEFGVSAQELRRRDQFFQHLGRQLRPGETVADRFDNAELESMWAMYVRIGGG